MDFPKVREAVKLLHEDQGLEFPDIPGYVLIDSAKQTNKAVKKKREGFVLPKNFANEQSSEAIDWERVEGFLATLSQDDLETFCIGEQDDMIKISERNEDGAYAHLAIGDLFELLGC